MTKVSTSLLVLGAYLTRSSLKKVKTAKFILISTIEVYGNNYPSTDGTAIRDYIHVTDLASAHIQAAKYLNKENKSITLNCGYGKGYSVKKVIDTFNKMYDEKVLYTYVKKRPGDLFKSIANVSLLKKKLNWQPKNNSLKKILESSLMWEKKLNRND